MSYVSTMKDTQDMVITIYRDGFGVVKEKRRLHTPINHNIIQYYDVAQQIEIDSVIVNGLEILEFNYDFDLANKEKLLENYLDNTVFLHDKDSNAKTECTLLSTKGGIVLENKYTKKLIINPSEELVLPKLSTGIISKPALIWKIKSISSKDIGVSYITKGLTWTANYVIQFKENTLDIVGWINISNTSGNTYEKTKIKLFAGEIKRIKKDISAIMDDEFRSLNTEADETRFNNSQIYPLLYPTTLKNNQEKQINFFSCLGVSYKKHFDINQDNISKIITTVEFENHQEKNIGMLLPRGIVKVYKEDPIDHYMEFIGEYSIKDTPVDKNVILQIGDIYDGLGQGKRANIG